MFLLRAVRYLALLILGGLLSPVEFGVFAALFVIIDGLALLQGFGIGQALIYRKSQTNEAADTSFILSLGIGVLLFVAAWFLAPVIARFYREEAMIPLFRAASALLVVHGFRLVPFRLFEKALDFRKKLVPTLAGSVAYFATAVTLALRGAGAWSLVGAEIASVLAETVAYWLVSPWRPTFNFSRRLAHEDLSFGWIVVGGSALIFAFRNVDRVVLSRLMGTHALGVYAFAYSLANLPATLFVRVLNTVLFPSYSALDDDREQQRSLFLRATSYMAAAGLLYTTGLVFFGRYFLLAMYDQKWIEAALPLSTLAFFALFRSLAALVGDLLVATGHPNTFRAIMALQLVLAAGGLYFGATMGGIAGVALVMAAAQAVSLVASWVAAGRIFGARAGELAQSVRGPLGACAVSAVAASFVLAAMPPEGNLLALGAAVIGISALFLVVWFAADRQFRSELVRVLGRGEAA